MLQNATHVAGLVVLSDSFYQVFGPRPWPSSSSRREYNANPSDFNILPYRNDDFVQRSTGLAWALQS
ncbi:hypothetical protein KHC23_09175 [Ancylobacter dichloromethanicus]|uniref:hypothetical protein n=1 Tax=Ancylobacter dichloromethanicus TaxID=518825 RepID=UPI001BD0B729|nr:hypothetical protein [Ancylobacter dichloromethanicus]MBS7553823.1 hypothetical protein [Ancylobacter dichloromethanicus]